MIRHNHGLRIIGEGSKNVQLQPTGGGRAVDAFAQRHERDADGLHVLQQRHEVFQIAAEAIQPPDDQDVESATPCVRHQPIKGWPTVRGAADGTVYKFNRRPTSRFNVSPQFDQLVLARLISSGKPLRKSQLSSPRFLE